MGVRGLQSFMERNNPDSCKRVSLKQMAEKYRGTHDGKDPVIVVDAANCMRYMYGKLSLEEGGQWRQYFQQVKEFVKKFRSAGIELVFFCDTAVVDDKRDEWISRRKESLDMIAKFFSDLRNGVGRPVMTSVKSPPGQMIYQSIVLNAAGCKAIRSKRECDQEIAEYALKNDCLAILAQDSDYVIFNTVPYLSIEHLKLDTLETVMYDRNQLARNMGIKVSHFPLFSCLLGNDVVSKEGMKPFHGKLCEQEMRRMRSRYPPVALLFQKVLGFMRSHKIQLCSSVEVDSVLEQICRDVHYPGLSFEEKLAVMKRGLAFYSMAEMQERDINPVLKVSESVEKLAEASTTAFNLVYSGTYSYAASLEEENGDLQYSAFLYKPIRQRMYFLLQAGQEEDMVPVKEWIPYPGNKFQGPEIALPLQFPVDVGSLKEIWFEDDPDQIDKKWELFRSMMGISIPATELKKLQPESVSVCCLVNHWLQDENKMRVEEWEMKALILQAVTPVVDDLNAIKRIQVPRLNARAVLVASLFGRGIVNVMEVLELCGHPVPLESIMPWHCFDGKVFHDLYVKLEQQPSTPELDLMEGSGERLNCFHELRRVAFMGTCFEE